MRTKLLFLLLAMSFLALPYNSISAQEPIKNEATYTGKSTKFALMVSDVVHFQSALNTVEAMNIKKNNFTFEIVVIGKLAKDLVENKDLKTDIDRSEKLGSKIVVCEGALSYFNVSKEQLDNRLFTVKNAWIYMFQLQDDGYNTLSV